MLIFRFLGLFKLPLEYIYMLSCSLSSLCKSLADKPSMVCFLLKKIDFCTICIKTLFEKIKFTGRYFTSTSSLLLQSAQYQENRPRGCESIPNKGYPSDSFHKAPIHTAVWAACSNSRPTAGFVYTVTYWIQAIFISLKYTFPLLTRQRLEVIAPQVGGYKWQTIGLSFYICVIFWPQTTMWWNLHIIYFASTSPCSL